ncbi:hypothetical protein LLEC1_00495, partial [Akanthomyces lecanii]
KRILFSNATSFELLQTTKGRSYIPKVTLDEAVIMRKISIFRVRCGRVTAIVLVQIDQACRRLDRLQLFNVVESAVKHLHAMGLECNHIYYISI